MISSLVPFSSKKAFNFSFSKLNSVVCSLILFVVFPNCLYFIFISPSSNVNSSKLLIFVIISLILNSKSFSFSLELVSRITFLIKFINFSYLFLLFSTKFILFLISLILEVIIEYLSSLTESIIFCVVFFSFSFILVCSKFLSKSNKSFIFSSIRIVIELISLSNG